VIRVGTVLASLLFLHQALPASAGVPRPVCLAPSVLDAMTHAIKKRDYYARIEPRLMGEESGVQPNTVWCAVPVSTLSYNTYRADGIPLWRCEQYIFSVRALSNGFVIRYLNKGPWFRAQQ
jgi:hypothetical protein